MDPVDPDPDSDPEHWSLRTVVFSGCLLPGCFLSSWPALQAVALDSAFTVVMVLAGIV